MTDNEIRDYLKEHGHPEHIWRGGRTGLLDLYRRFVEQVETGYSLTLDDYRNDLDVRAIISRLGLVDESVELDRRLRTQLEFSQDAIWDCDDNPDAFWLYGYPKNAAGDLRDDLIAEGFIK